MIGKVVFLVFLLSFGIGLGAYNYYVSYTYDRDIGSHIDNAYEVNTPDKMIEELKLAKQEMRNNGLTENDYGAFFFKKPSNSMEFQYEFLDSIIERAEAVETWYNLVYSETSTSQESLGDVYEQKMDNLREFILEGGRSDWIAKDAWYIKNHIFLYFSWIFWLIWIMLTILMFAWLFSDSLY